MNSGQKQLASYTDFLPSVAVNKVNSGEHQVSVASQKWVPYHCTGMYNSVAIRNVTATPRN